MSRLTQIVPDTATGKTKELLDAVKSKLGLVPNMVRAMANSPAALNAYVQFSGVVARFAVGQEPRADCASGRPSERMQLLPFRRQRLGQDGRLYSGPDP